MYLIYGIYDINTGDTSFVRGKFLNETHAWDLLCKWNKSHINKYFPVLLACEYDFDHDYTGDE